MCRLPEPLSRFLADGLPAVTAALMLASVMPAFAQPASNFGLGRAPTAHEIAAWDIDVRPDGHGVKSGRGTVAQGQKVYEAQCASCHGTFGENNRYLQIAGGVRKGDLETGRAAALRESDGIRTLGTRLNHASTLWDYTYRAMPWSNPQSLSVDETYAVTAYVLHLNDIVPADFELNESTLLSLAMPNRNGMTREHGLASVQGRPDAQGSKCMSNCANAVTIVSQIPEFARNQSGNLAEQKRGFGPTRGIDTARYVAPAATLAAATMSSPLATPPAQLLLTRNACTACHGMTSALVGPAFSDIAAKYRARADAHDYLSQRIREGGQGVWGSVPMPPQRALKQEEVSQIARWIVDGAK